MSEARGLTDTGQSSLEKSTLRGKLKTSGELPTFKNFTIMRFF